MQKRCVAIKVRDVTPREALAASLEAAEAKPRQDHRPAKGGRPRIEDRLDTIEAKKPWEALGMSRRTWYKRRAEQRNKPK